MEDHEYPNGLGEPVAVFSTRQAAEAYVVRLRTSKARGVFVAREWAIFDIPFDPPTSRELDVPRSN